MYTIFAYGLVLGYFFLGATEESGRRQRVRIHIKAMLFYSSRFYPLVSLTRFFPFILSKSIRPTESVSSPQLISFLHSMIEFQPFELSFRK